MPGPTYERELAAFVGRWRFATAAPDADLAGTVAEYWEVEGRLAPFREKILPNGCLEMMVDLGPPHVLIEGRRRTVWEHSWFSGLHERSIEIQSEHGTHLVSARLTPLGAWRLFGPSAPAAANRVVDLAVLAGPAAGNLRTELLAAPTAEVRFGLLDRFLRDRLPEATSPSGFVAAALEAIDRTHGTAKVSTLHASLGVSRKHLTVTFGREIGMPPKAYAQVRRFITTLAHLRARQSVNWAKLAMNAGYADQSHLVRDFRRVAGASPTDFLAKRSPDNTALLEEAR